MREYFMQKTSAYVRSGDNEQKADKWRCKVTVKSINRLTWMPEQSEEFFFYSAEVMEKVLCNVEAFEIIIASEWWIGITQTEAEEIARFLKFL